MSDRLQQFGESLRDGAERIFVRNFHLKAIAFLLTCALYLWVGEDRETQIITALPVNIEIPEDQVLLQPKLDKVNVTLRGRWSALEDFDQSDLKPIVLELSNSDDGQAVPITPGSVDVPPGLRVASIEPSVVRVEMEKKVDKELNIRPRIVGRTRGSYQVGEVETKPETVIASGPEEVMAEISSIPTEPIDVTGRVRSFKKRVQLRPENPMVVYKLDQPVTVSIPINAEQIEKTLREISVTAVNTTYRTEISPTAVELTIRGPRSRIEQLDQSSLHAVVDLSEEDERSPGRYEKEVKIRNLPDDVELVRREPKHFVVTTNRRAESAPDDGSDADTGNEKPNN